MDWMDKTVKNGQFFISMDQQANYMTWKRLAIHSLRKR